MNQRVQISILCLLMAGSSMLATGCMTTPGHGEFIGKPSDKVSFQGYLRYPNEWVRIEAYHDTHGWQTIGWAKSANYAYHWDGKDFYPWHNGDIVVPATLWHYIGSGYVAAEVRALQHSKGGALATLEAGFYEYWDYNSNVMDLADEHMHGFSATIFAKNGL